MGSCALLPFHLTSRCVKLGELPLLLQSLNSVKGQCGLCQNHTLHAPHLLSREKANKCEQPGGEEEPAKNKCEPQPHNPLCGAAVHKGEDETDPK